MINGKDIRLGKLFSHGEKSVVIAIDHGMFDGPIPGMINLKETASRINPDVDGVLISPGMLEICKSIFSFRGAPLPIVRLNWSDVYCFHWKYNEANTVIARTVEDAVAEGAEVVLASLTIGTGNPRTDARNVEVYATLAGQARKLGIPVIGEFFPVHSDSLSAEQLHEQVLSGCRILAELGVDLIKTFHTFDFRKVAESTPVPILCLGAEKKPTQLQALQLAADEINDNAAGVVFGRNAIQVPDPYAFQSALCDVVKKGLKPEEAARKYRLTD
ncbi:MAG: hypothetical protein GYA22_07250 [Bacteroidales bacterium]|nr:hypothetical protein [Bacteroidales bacterium]